jgi:phosphate starvation-inducible PhoH-like protein
MKMFLTRLGFGTKTVVTGDVTQVDLPSGRPSGLRDVEGLLAPVEGIAFNYFSDADVVRHPLVQEIVRAYDRREERRHAARDGERAAAEPFDEGDDEGDDGRDLGADEADDAR